MRFVNNFKFLLFSLITYYPLKITKKTKRKLVHAIYDDLADIQRTTSIATIDKGDFAFDFTPANYDLLLHQTRMLITRTRALKGTLFNLNKLKSRVNFR